MIDRILLNIRHSDDYTDYLFLTAGLTNKRIVPMLDPSRAEIKAQSNGNTIVIGCYNSLRKPDKNDCVATYDEKSRIIHILSKFYLAEDGSVNATQSGIARSIIQEKLNDILFSCDNLHEVYRRYFPIFWRKREDIYANPLLFYAKTGTYSYSSWSFFPLGVMLKTIESEEDLFRIRQGGGCHCEQAPLVIDYDTDNGEWDNTSWKLHTWCPRCFSRREIAVGYAGGYESRLEATYRQFDRTQGLSPLSLFDVADILSIVRR